MEISSLENILVSNKFFSFIIKVIITLFILGWMLSYIPLQDYHRVLSVLSFRPLVLILLLVITQVIFLSIRWNLLAQSFGSHLSMRYSFYGILMSFFFSQGLPASIGGDAFRLWWHRREGIQTEAAFKIIFFDRLYGLLSLVLLCFLSLFLLVQTLKGIEKLYALTILMMISSVVLIGLIFPWRIGLSKHLLQMNQYLSGFLNKLLVWIVSTRQILREQKIRTTLLFLAIGLITHLFVVMEVYVLGKYLAIETITFWMSIAVVPPALFVSYMPFSIAGWGVREASMVVAFGLLGVSAGTAVLISLVLGAAVFSIASLGGLIWISGGFRAAFIKERILVHHKAE